MSSIRYRNVPVYDIENFRVLRYDKKVEVVTRATMDRVDIYEFKVAASAEGHKAPGQIDALINEILVRAIKDYTNDRKEHISE